MFVYSTNKSQKIVNAKELGAIWFIFSNSIFILKNNKIFLVGAFKRYVLKMVFEIIVYKTKKNENNYICFKANYF